MCGINGFNFKNEGLIRKMNDKIQHRGPDAEGIYFDENISLGHRRLSIIDLSDNGKQPMFNEDKSLCLVFNGEIYNFKELKEGLEKRGHKFISQTDSEVILHLYEEHKEQCPKFLNGIFAFAVWDIKNKELFLCRDRIGVKPLYYYWNPSNSSGQAKLIFSSEIKAILEHDIKREIDPEALNYYFRLSYIPAPLTMFKGVYKLSQGHSLLLSGQGKIKIEQYWDIDDFSTYGGSAADRKEAIIREIQRLMERSVRGQIISDRPVGVFLSGGIDSTSVLGMARKFLSGGIKTFTAGFNINDPNNKFNADFLLARETSKIYNTEHHELLISSSDVLKNIEKVVYHMDEPVAEATQIATFLLSQIAKKEVAVVLGGDGGDELFGGYKRYYYSYLLSRYGVTKVMPFLRSMIHKRFIFQKEDEINEVLNKTINKKGLTDKFFKNNYFKNKPVKDFEKLFMLIDLKTWLADESLMRTDKMTMAHGLEQRVPILDHYLVELAMKIPTKYKMADRNHGKQIFIEAMKEFLPEHILKSEQKKVWLMPMSEWLRTDLNEFASRVLSPDYCPETSKYLNFEGIKKIFDNHVNRKKYNLNLIWAIIVFQVWCKKYIYS